MIKKGLSPRFSEIGKIKIGGKGETRPTKDKKSTYQLPVKYNHFVVTTTEKGPDGNYLPHQEIMSKLGKEPKEISIRLPFDDTDMNFFTSFQFYKGKKCVCKGDGEHATRAGADGVSKQIICNPDDCKFLQNTIDEVDTPDKCKPSGILSTHLTDCMEIGGIYRFRTHSWNSIAGIMYGLDYIFKGTNGILRGMPLKLKLIKKATAEHGNVNIVTVVLDNIEFEKMRELAKVEHEQRFQIGMDMKQIESDALNAGFTIDTDDPADVQAEFYTPTVDNTEIIGEPGTTADETADKLKNDKPENTGTEGNLL